jgi:hypothetical protein
MPPRCGMQWSVSRGTNFENATVIGGRTPLNFFVFFARQALGNPIERQETELQGDKCPIVPVQNIFKKVKKNLVRGQILN